MPSAMSSSPFVYDATKMTTKLMENMISDVTELLFIIEKEFLYQRDTRRYLNYY